MACAPDEAVVVVCLPLCGCFFEFVAGRLFRNASGRITGAKSDHCVASLGCVSSRRFPSLWQVYQATLDSFEAERDDSSVRVMTFRHERASLGVSKVLTMPIHLQERLASLMRQVRSLSVASRARCLTVRLCWAWLYQTKYRNLRSMLTSSRKPINQGHPWQSLNCCEYFQSVH